MSRALTIAVLVMFAACCSAVAQRTSAHSGFGRSFPAHSSPGSSYHSNAPSMTRGFSSRNGFRGFHGIHDGFPHHVRGRYPFYGYAGYYDPYWWWDSSSSYDEDHDREVALAREMDAANQEEQNAREQQDWSRDIEQDSFAPRRQVGREEVPSVGPATVLVFRDQHRLEVQNYAIAGGMLWVLSEQVTKKIPLVDLDLEATAKLNDERGVDFQVPEPALSIMIVR